MCGFKGQILALAVLFQANYFSFVGACLVQGVMHIVSQVISLLILCELLVLSVPPYLVLFVFTQKEVFLVGNLAQRVSELTALCIACMLLLVLNTDPVYLSILLLLVIYLFLQVCCVLI